jgi:hypothetical protein
MKAQRPVSIFSRGNIAIAILFIACIINSCKRDSKSTSPMPSDVDQAKTWYESSYPSSGSTNSSLGTQSTGGSRDLSKLIKPDWQHAASYVSNNKNVIEIPVDPAAKFISTVKIGNKALNKAYSRSSYLLINDGKNYHAYILTIIADSAYVNNDLSKLSHNTYRKQDADFSGLALYYSPKGDYLGGYAYKNGQMVTPTTTTQQTGGQKIQSVNNGNLKPNDMVVECTDWYQQGVILNADGSIYEVTTPWEYIGTTCTSYQSGGSGGSTGTGSSGGSGSSLPSPPPCPPGTTSGIPTTSPCIPRPSTVESIGTGKLKVDYMPLPGSSPCSVSTPPVPCPISNSDIANAVPVADGKPAINPSKYINCFTDGKTASGYKLTIYVTQPVPGANDQFTTATSLLNPSAGEMMMLMGGEYLNVGHTFIGFEKDNTDGTSVKQVMGFYPGGNGVDSKGVIKDDSGHPYNVSYTISATAAQFNAALSGVVNDNANSKYILSNIQPGTERNCTDAAITWINAGGAHFPYPPSTTRGAFIEDPGDFGQALAGVSGAKTVAGTAPQGHGPCN